MGDISNMKRYDRPHDRNYAVIGEVLFVSSGLYATRVFKGWLFENSSGGLVFVPGVGKGSE